MFEQGCTTRPISSSTIRQPKSCGATRESAGLFRSRNKGNLRRFGVYPRTDDLFKHTYQAHGLKELFRQGNPTADLGRLSLVTKGSPNLNRGGTEVNALCRRSRGHPLQSPMQSGRDLIRSLIFVPPAACLVHVRLPHIESLGHDSAQTATIKTAKHERENRLRAPAANVVDSFAVWPHRESAPCRSLQARSVDSGCVLAASVRGAVGWHD